MIAALVLLVTILAQATPTPNPETENRAPVVAPPAPGMPSLPAATVDRTFALAAIQGNFAELDMAQLALRRGNANEVKGYARKMLDEHARLMQDMDASLRRALGAGAMPQRLAAPDALALRHLQTVADVDFDQDYAMQQVGDHLATMTAFRTEAEDGTDTQLKALARKWLPTIQAHLELATDLARHIGGSNPFKR
jgi:putative membrane protein